VIDASEFSKSDFLTLLGVELDGGKKDGKDFFHIVGFGLNDIFKVSSKFSVAQEAIDMVRSHGGEAFFAHPYWTGQDAHDLMLSKGAIGLEIFNTRIFVEIAKGISTVHWDDLLDRGTRPLGFATDDSHWKDFEDSFGGWIMVKAASLTKTDIMESIRNGSFYSSRGPEINDIQLDHETVMVSCSPVDTINFICDKWKGRSIRARDYQILTEAEFTLKGEEKYVRIECVDAVGRAAWSNPIFLK